MNGVNTGIVQSSTQGGFAGGGSGSGDAGSGSSPPAQAASLPRRSAPGPRSLPSTPLNFKGFTDHTVAEQGNAFTYGVVTFKQNTIEGLANYTQNFPLGTGLAVNYEGQRFANNSQYGVTGSDALIVG